MKQPQFAIYKGDKLLVMGSKMKCARELDVTPDYIAWMTSPAAQRRLETRKHPERCTIGVRIDDEED